MPISFVDPTVSFVSGLYSFDGDLVFLLTDVYKRAGITGPSTLALVAQSRRAMIDGSSSRLSLRQSARATIGQDSTAVWEE